MKLPGSHFTYSIIQAEPEACGLMPPRSGQYSTSGARPTSFRVCLPRKGSQVAINAYENEVNGSPDVTVGGVFHKTLSFLILMFFSDLQKNHDI